MLDQRRRRWANIEQELSERHGFAGRCSPSAGTMLDQHRSDGIALNSYYYPPNICHTVNATNTRRWPSAVLTLSYRLRQ